MTAVQKRKNYRSWIKKRALIDNGDGTHTVPLTRGQVAIIDSDDADKVGRWNWACGSYAFRIHNCPVLGRRVHMTIHRVVMDAPPGLEVDHINGNRFDNRKSNLRLATHRQNGCNTRLRKNSRSGLKGASWHPQSQMWRARVYSNGREIHLGLFDTAEAAHAAYREHASRIHGQFARTA